MRRLNHYQLLELSESCSSEMIEHSWKLLMRRYHPDNRETGHAETAKAINIAHDILSDPEKRALYDHQLKSERAPIAMPVQRRGYPQAYPPAYPFLNFDLDGLAATFTGTLFENLGLRSALQGASEAVLEKLAEDNPAIAEVIRRNKQRRRTG